MLTEEEIRLHNKEYKAAYYQKHKDDPGFKEKCNIASKKQYARRKDDPGYKEQRKRYKAAYHQKHKDDPEYIKSRKSRNAAFRQKHKDDPEFKNKRRLYNAAYRQKHKDDPEFKNKRRLYNAAFRQKHKDDPELAERLEAGRIVRAIKNKFNITKKLQGNMATRAKACKHRETISIKNYRSRNKDTYAIPVFQAMVGVSKIRELEHVN